MVKHMVKDAYALAASLSVLADARRHIEQYPSSAEDAHTAARCTRHFLQRVLNAGATELAPTQAAAIVLAAELRASEQNEVALRRTMNHARDSAMRVVATRLANRSVFRAWCSWHAQWRVPLHDPFIQAKASLR